MTAHINNQEANMAGPVPPTRPQKIIAVSQTDEGIQVSLNGKSYSLKAMHDILQRWMADRHSPDAEGLDHVAARLREGLVACVGDKRLGLIFKGAIANEEDAALYTLTRTTTQVAGSLVSAAQKRIPKAEPVSNYEKWAQACRRVDLTESCAALTKVCAMPNIIQARLVFLDLFRTRLTKLAGTDLDYRHDPKSTCNRLFLSVAKTLFPIQSTGELTLLLYPDIRHTFAPALQGRLLALEKQDFTKALNTSFHTPLSAEALGGLLTVGDTAVLAQDFKEITTAKRSRLAPGFWLPMKTEAPELYERLTEEHTELTQLQTGFGADQKKTPTLKANIEHLIKAFCASGAHGKGSEKQAGAGAQIALELFESDWALFTSLHQTRIGKRLAAILLDVKTGYASVTGCVEVAAAHLQALLESPNDTEKALLAETRERPVKHKAALNLAGVGSTAPKKLPTDYALKTKPFVNAQSVFYYILDMPASVFPALLSGFSYYELLGLNFSQELDPETNKTFLLAREAAMKRALAQESPAKLLKNYYWADFRKLMDGPEERFLQFIKKFKDAAPHERKALLDKTDDPQGWVTVLLDLASSGKTAGFKAWMELYQDDQPRLKRGLLRWQKWGCTTVTQAYFQKDPTMLHLIQDLFKDEPHLLKNALNPRPATIRSSLDNRANQDKIELLLHDPKQLKITMLDQGWLERLLNDNPDIKYSSFFATIFNVLRRTVPPKELVKKFGQIEYYGNVLQMITSRNDPKLLEAFLQCYKGAEQALVRIIMSGNGYKTGLFQVKDLASARLLLDAFNAFPNEKEKLMRMRNEKGISTKQHLDALVFKDDKIAGRHPS